MTKVAFCFPGQGSLEEGMGREIAEAFPAAREVYRIGSEATGLDLEELCFSTPLEKLVETEVQQPALVATSLAILAAMRERGLEPDVVVGHSVGEFAALAAAGSLETGAAIGLVRERGLAMAEAARQRPGRDGGDPRSRRRGGREALPQDRRRVAGELQLPGTDRRLGRARGGRGVLRRGREPRRPTSRDAQGLGRVPQPARRESGGPAAPGARARALRRAALAVHVHRDREDRACAEDRGAARRPADRARAVHAGGDASSSARGATTFVEVGPGNVLSGLVKRIDRGVKTMSVNSLESLERAQEALAR